MPDNPFWRSAHVMGYQEISGNVLGTTIKYSLGIIFLVDLLTARVV